MTSYLVFQAIFWRILLHVSRAAAGFQTAPFLLFLFPLVVEGSHSLHVLLASPFDQPSSKRFVLIHYSHKDSEYWMLLSFFFFPHNVVCLCGGGSCWWAIICLCSLCSSFDALYLLLRGDAVLVCILRNDAPFIITLVRRPRARAHRMRENTIW